MPNVDYTRDELVKLLPAYDLIQDCIDGEMAVKLKGDIYLRRPDPTDTSAENLARFDDYLKGAVFYNTTQRTLKGLTGQIFMRDPVIEVPAALDVVVKDANGQGVDLQQVAQMLCDFTLSYGRCSIFIDYPKTEKTATVADLKAGNIRPTIVAYGPKDIINWRTITRGGKTILSLVVISEMYDASLDDFEILEKRQWRVLRLIDNVYTVEIWREGKDGNAATDTYTPKDGFGNLIDEIPFMFIGSANNDSKVDYPPLYDLASINIGHYRNSADYEESVFVVGQPTLLIAGLTLDWVKNTDAMKMGSRTAITLPTGASGSILQVEPNMLAYEAMQHKERQMVALGAKLVEQKQVQRTAFETGVEEASETSILSTSAKNVSAAIKWGLEWCAIYLGITTVQNDAETDTIKFELNTDYDLTSMEPGDRAQLIKEWQADAITFEEMRNALRRGGIATEDDEAAKTKIDEQRAAAMELENDDLETKTAITQPPEPPIA